jgi:NAD-dependent dihydropyrimidine dehydrogenase PreA subunit|tara:strand:+ start:1962 stop:2321 length:360 start_codon:yes stop_codon:yes gene_type:complete
VREEETAVSEENVYLSPNPASAARPIAIDPEKCTGCNLCVNVCPADVFVPNPEAGRVPLVLFVDECWYCGPCVDECPHEGAIRLNYPVMWRVPWKRKETGRHYWLGMKNPPPPNDTPPA